MLDVDDQTTGEHLFLSVAERLFGVVYEVQLHPDAAWAVVSVVMASIGVALLSGGKRRPVRRASR
jgi:hypothetical protein